MAFLSGLAAFGGGFADEALAVQTAKSNQALKQEQIQLREAQLALLMQKTTQAQDKSLEQGAIYGDPAYQAIIGDGGTAPSDPTALQFAPSDATATPSAGQTGAAGLPPFATPQARPAPAAGRGAPSGQPPVTQVAPAGQPAGAAGAGIPAPPPVGGSTLSPGDPLAQFGQQLQGAGQARMQAGAQPTVQPGPSGAPSFDQRWQDPTPMQAKTVQTQRIPGAQPSLGGGPPQAPLPDQTLQPPGSKGKRLFDKASPEEQKQIAEQQQQQSPEQQQRAQAQKMAQAPEQTIMEIVKKHTRNPADIAKNYEGALKHYYQSRALRIKQEAAKPGKPPSPAMVDAIGQYRERPPPMYGKNAAANKATMDAVLEKYPDYDERKYYGSLSAERAKDVLPAKGEQSFITQNSRSVTSFNVLVSHLRTLEDTVDALNKGYNNVPSSFLREIRNYWLEKFGSELPTDFKGVRDIVGFELIKAITGGAQALGDREEIRNALNAANSPQQLRSLIKRYTDLSKGQLQGLEKKYQSQSGKEDFQERFLTGATRKMFLEEGKSSEANQPSESVRSKAKEPGTYTIKTQSGDQHWKLDSSGGWKRLD